MFAGVCAGAGGLCVPCGPGSINLAATSDRFASMCDFCSGNASPRRSVTSPVGARLGRRSSSQTGVGPVSDPLTPRSPLLGGDAVARHSTAATHGLPDVCAILRADDGQPCSVVLYFVSRSLFFPSHRGTVGHCSLCYGHCSLCCGGGLVDHLRCCHRRLRPAGPPTWF